MYGTSIDPRTNTSATCTGLFARNFNIFKKIKGCCYLCLNDDQRKQNLHLWFSVAFYENIGFDWPCAQPADSNTGLSVEGHLHDLWFGMIEETYLQYLQYLPNHIISIRLSNFTSFRCFGWKTWQRDFQRFIFFLFRKFFSEKSILGFKFSSQFWFPRQKNCLEIEEDFYFALIPTIVIVNQLESVQLLLFIVTDKWRVLLWLLLLSRLAPLHFKCCRLNGVFVEHVNPLRFN